MRSLVTLILSSAILTGCSAPKLPSDIRLGSLDSSLIQSLNLSEEEISREKLAFESAWKKATDIEYAGLENYWQNPLETEALNQGLCKDISIYLDYLLRKEGIESRVVFGKTKKNNENYHPWNEVILGGEKYLVDPTHKSRMLMKEIEKDTYIECQPHYSWKESIKRINQEMRQHSK